MAALLFTLAFISLLPQALGLDCWGCHSNKSWADCENNLVSRFCDDDPDWACMTKVIHITKTRYGNGETYYIKECVPRSECDAAECNMKIRNTTYRCQLECCCHDNCNTGVLLPMATEAGVVWKRRPCIILPINWTDLILNIISSGLPRHKNMAQWTDILASILAVKNGILVHGVKLFTIKGRT